MRHIIVHLVRGEASQVHIGITKDLTEKFDTFPLHNRISPHLTLKRWFELDEVGMAKIYETLGAFSKAHRQSNYKIQGFGSFNKDVIYEDIQPSPEMTSSLADLRKRLHEVENLTFDEFDEVDELHATVVMGALKPFNFDEIWDYLSKGKYPDFNMKFDNIAVLKKESNMWVVDRVWEIKP